MLRFLEKLYNGKTDRTHYIVLSLLGIFIFPIYAFLMIILTLNIFGPDLLEKYPIIAICIFILIVLFYAVYQNILNVRRLHDTGNTSNMLIYRGFPYGGYFVDLFLLFAKSKKNVKNKENLT